MNKENILHQNDLGFVRICCECNEIQVVVGNIFGTLSLSEFFQLKTNMNRIHTEIMSNEIHMGQQNERKRNIVITSPIKSVKFLFCPAELDEFVELLNLSSVVLEAKNQLNTHEKRS